MQEGDWLLAMTGTWLRVEEVFNTGTYDRVYNMRVQDWHTYFVGRDDWGFDVWAHNAECAGQDSRKPSQPDEKKWVGKGGTVDRHGDGSVTYTDWQGNKVKYNAAGYPDFKAARMVKAEVKIDMKGNYTTDFTNADALSSVPRNRLTDTWHHSEDLTTMQLIDRTLHNRFSHTGGVSIINNQ